MGLGVFGLKSVYKKQLENISSRKTTNVSEDISYGYITGGQGSIPSVCLITRIDFNTETVTTAIRLGSRTRSKHGIVRNSSYAYFGGGIVNGLPISCTIDRLDFSTETCGLLSNYFVTAPGMAGVTAYSLFGYFGGGYDPALPTPPKYACLVYRLDFSSEIISQPGNNLPYSRNPKGFSSQAYSRGYFTGGTTPLPAPNFVSTTERIDFSTESITTLPTSSGISRERAAISDNNFYAYLAAQEGGASNSISKFNYSTEGVSTLPPTNALTTTRASAQAVSSRTYGYFACGFGICTVDRLDFNTETSTLPSMIIANAVYIGEGVAEVPGTRPVNTGSFANFSESAVYGYFGGGSTFSPSTYICKIDRLDFSTETVSVPGKNLTEARQELAAVSSSSYGYFGGGLNTPTTRVCILDRLDFSTETVTVPTSHLTQARGRSAAVSNSNYGYFGGGTPGSSTIRLDFSTETTSTSAPGKNLSQRKDSLAAFSNNSYGYFGGGLSIPGSNNVCTIDRLDFSTETVTIPGKQLSRAISNLSAVSSSSYGYFGGGFDSLPVSPLNRTCSIDRFDFSNEISSLSLSSLSRSRRTLSATENSFYGLFVGGFGPAGDSSTIDHLDFYNETISAPTSRISTSRQGLAAVSGGQSQRVLVGRTAGTYGYFSGGFSPPGGINICKIDRLDFYNETVSAPAPQLTQARRNLATVSNSNYGYFGGGQEPGAIFSCTIDRLDFSNETVTGPPIHGINLTRARAALGGVSNSSYGYFVGGNNPSSVSTIDRLDFSNETVSEPGKNLPQGRQGLAVVSNSNYGYFADSPNASAFCSIHRLDLSNETVLVSGNNLTQARNDLAGVSNSNYGYFAGGFYLATYFCTIDRLDFSTETVSAPGTYQLTQAKNSLAAATSSSYGYFGGGTIPPAIYFCTIDRLDFSNETVSSPVNNLTSRAGLAAVSTEQRASTGQKGFQSFTATYGYFAGSETPGAPPIATSTVNRLDFNNETVSLPGNDLTQARGRFAATSSANYGYFGGGSEASTFNTIDRIDFSTETTSAPGKNLINASEDLTAFTNGSYGYFGAGVQQKTSFERLDFSNETVSAPGKNLTIGRSRAMSTSNSSYGYIIGGSTGSPPPATSLIERLDFSTETYLLPGYNLPDTRSKGAAVESISYGYFGCGNRTTAPNISTTTCTIDRLDFSTEVASRLKSGFDRARSGLAATTSATYGYFGGGSPPGNSPTISRFDIFNETTSDASTKLLVAGDGIAAVSSTYKPPIRNGWGWKAIDGYYTQACSLYRLSFSDESIKILSSQTQFSTHSAAISTPSYGIINAGTSLYKLEFSTDSATITPSELINTGPNSVFSINYGYFCGGASIGSGINTIERLEFSTDTISTPAPGKNLTIGRNQMGTGFNISYGYLGGGGFPPSTRICTIDRIDFSTENVSNPINLSLIKDNLNAVHSGSYLYFIGGQTPSAVSSIERLDFSSETLSTLTKFKPSANYGSVNCQSGSYGYDIGGVNPSTCRIDRLDFSNESFVTIQSSHPSTINQNIGIQAN